MSDPVIRLRAQISKDLREAMKARDLLTTTTLRSLLTVLDNAGAVPNTSDHVPVFGRTNEVPRRILTDSECQSLILAEISNRNAALIEFEKHGLRNEADLVRKEISIVSRYTCA